MEAVVSAAVAVAATDTTGMNNRKMSSLRRSLGIATGALLATSGGRYWQPHMRIYQQSAADFYTPFFGGSDRPTAGDASRFASADYRLGEFTGMTLGLEYGRRTTSSGWSVAAEYYLQSGSEPDNKFGALADQTLFPDVDAFFVRLIRDF